MNQNVNRFVVTPSLHPRTQNQRQLHQCVNKQCLCPDHLHRAVQNELRVVLKFLGVRNTFYRQMSGAFMPQDIKQCVYQYVCINTLHGMRFGKAAEGKFMVEFDAPCIQRKKKRIVGRTSLRAPAGGVPCATQKPSHPKSAKTLRNL